MYLLSCSVVNKWSVVKKDIEMEIGICHSGIKAIFVQNLIDIGLVVFSVIEPHR